ncbi:hypothetical protein NOCA2580024 [metagenome]|uniref:WD40 repeat domain-containing protein n=1 Tax=metagenome TaxID=256318 RepID=A0A2P2CEC7_9ZZZZ
MNDTENDLDRALSRQVEHLHGHLVTLPDVKQRARGIQRRRRIAASVSAAAVVAIIAPIGLMFADNQPDSAPPVSNPTGTTQSPTVNPTKTPTQTPGDNGGEAPRYDIDLTPPAEGTTGAEPGIPYWFDGQLVAASGDTVPTDQRIYHPVIDPTSGQWAGVTFDDQEGTTAWASLDPQGGVLETSPTMADAVAITPDGSSYAYIAKISPDGPGDPTWTLVKAGGDPQTWDLGTTDSEAPGGGPQGILDDGTVVFEFESGKPMLAKPDGSIAPLPGKYLRAVDAAPDGRVAVQTSYNDDGTSCWAVVDLTGDKQATTCDHALGEFSADGRYVMGYPSGTDGLGASVVSILDAQTLKPAANFTVPRGAFIWLPMAWSDDTLLAQVWFEGTWRLEHLSLDGVLQQRSVAVQADETAAPFQFGAGPLF